MVVVFKAVVMIIVDGVLVMVLAVMMIDSGGGGSLGVECGGGDVGGDDREGCLSHGGGHDDRDSEVVGEGDDGAGG